MLWMGRKVRLGPTVDEKEEFRAMATAQLNRLYATARRLVGDEAEDAVQ